jgi:GSH-dependent disulfide-bond oxidoreductase
MFGGVGYFHKFAGRQIADKLPLARYRDATKRLLGVLEAQLVGKQWIMRDDDTIGDISMLGWVRNLVGFSDALTSSTSMPCARILPGSRAGSPAPLCSAG